MTEPSRVEEVQAELLRAEKSLRLNLYLMAISWKTRFLAHTMRFSMPLVQLYSPKE